MKTDFSRITYIEHLLPGETGDAYRTLQRTGVSIPSVRGSVNLMKSLIRKFYTREEREITVGREVIAS